MKRMNIIYYILLIICVFLIGCSSQTNNDQVIRLNVAESNANGLIATDDKAGRYDIPNSDFEVTDNNNNTLSWDELKNSKVIEVHFSGGILETYPASFGKITRVVIIS